MHSILHIIGVTLTVLGSISCIGLILLARQIYESVASIRTVGRILEWSKEEDAVPRYRARLSYTDAQGKQHTVLSTVRALESELKDHRLNEQVRIRYRTKDPDWAYIEGSVAERWWTPVVMLVFAAVCFAIAFRLP